ncbi:hypothetical protein RRG08_035605 [Elysia crispata]|uniref:Uncharacterized protein n=1 Tax=Elysia crispata TaxID=231223 RepID=A0AAE1B6Y7_9GAST|nr:hypothetical protein RRG08_035605 [Elysia crispata]
MKESLVNKNSSPNLHLLLNELESSVQKGPRNKTCSKKRKIKDSVIKTKIMDFFIEESVDLHGLKHYSKRLKKQKRILTEPISTLYRKFCSHFPDIRVSKRTFFRCRPGFVMSMKNQKFIQCLCETCENARLKLNALKVSGALITNLTEALYEALCAKSNGWWKPECVARKCKNCGLHLLQEKLSSWCDVNASITFKEWKQVFHPKYKVNRMELLETVSAKQLINLLMADLNSLALNIFTANWQRFQFKALKNDVPSDVAVIVADFAENHTCRHQREVASAHWSYNQVTVHPVVVYQRCPQCNAKITAYHVFVSDDLIHDSNFVFHVLHNVMSETSASKYVIFSDNCSVQYKSKLPFHHMSKLANSFQFERCYFGERHGKRECDLCGGMIKSFLTQAVASGKAVLRNAEEVLSLLKSQLSLDNIDCSHIVRSFHLVQESSVDRTLSSTSL